MVKRYDAWYSFRLFFLLLFIGMPVATAWSFPPSLLFFFDPSLTGIIIPQKLFTGMDSFLPHGSAFLHAGFIP